MREFVIRLNPLSIGSVFPTISGREEWKFSCVLIPFLSGLFFQRYIAAKDGSDVCLNPLSIGSVFPT